MSMNTTNNLFTLIENAEVYAPAPAGRQSLLLVGGQIAKMGDVDLQALRALGVPCTVVDAAGGIVTPGLIDPHEHLIGAGGEQGFASRTWAAPAADIMRAGITTVVGCLGTDTTTRHLTSLLARVRQLHAFGLSAYMYSGGFYLPTPTITESVRDDIVLIPEVLGVGEIAIADERSSDPNPEQLAKMVSEAMTGGLMAGKVGITHFHVGEAKRRLGCLHTIIERHDVPVETLYPTHLSRSHELMDDGIELAKRGAFIDIDTVDEQAARWLRYYHDHGGPAEQLTVSSDAQTPGGTPGKLYSQFVAATREMGLPLETVLPHFTSNTARALRLDRKGRLEPGCDADLLILKPETLAVQHVFARGQHLVADGQVIVNLPEAGENG